MPPQGTQPHHPQHSQQVPKQAPISVEYINRANKTLETIQQALQAPGGDPLALSSQLEKFFSVAKTIFQGFTTTLQEANSKDPGLKDIMKEI